jgi:phage-related protein
MRELRHHHKSSAEELTSWPDKVRKRVLHQLRELQAGRVATRCKLWRGNGWNGFEITTSAFRVVGTLEDSAAVVIFHAFRKDSASGSKTRQHDIDLIDQRHREWAATRARKKKNQVH